MSTWAVGYYDNNVSILWDFTTKLINRLTEIGINDPEILLKKIIVI